jgi:hypothetical protein
MQLFATVLLALATSWTAQQPPATKPTQRPTPQDSRAKTPTEQRESPVNASDDRQPSDKGRQEVAEGQPVEVIIRSMPSTPPDPWSRWSVVVTAVIGIVTLIFVAYQGYIMRGQRTAMEHQLSVMEGQRTAMERQLTVMEEQRTAMTDQLAVMGEQRTAMTDQLAVMEGQRKEMERQLTVMEGQRTAMTDQLAVMGQQHLAMRDQGVKAQLQVDALRNVANAGKSNAEAAKRNAEALISAERPWIIVSVIKLGTTFTLTATNYGRTPADVYAHQADYEFMNESLEDLPDSPTYNVAKLTHRRLVPPDEGEYPFWSSGDLGSQIKNNELTSNTFVIWGIVRYRNVLEESSNRAEHETRFCYVYNKHDQQLHIDGHKKYNTHT